MTTKNKTRVAATGLLVGLLAAGWLAANPNAGKARRLLVTVDERTGEPLTAAEFDVRLDGGAAEVVRVYQPSERPVRLALLIDDSTGAAVSGRLRELAGFLRSLPKGSEAMIAYLRRGKLITAQAFTSNLEGAAASLRAPSGVPDAGPTDLGQLIADTLALFPERPAARAQILYLGRGMNQNPGHAPRLQRAVQEAQHRGIAVWAIHIPPRTRSGVPEAATPGALPEASPAPGSPARYEDAYLDRLTGETGGRSFTLGQQPVGLNPSLGRFRALLDRQYLLEIDPREAKPGSRLTVEVLRRELQLLYPRH